MRMGMKILSIPMLMKSKNLNLVIQTKIAMILRRRMVTVKRHRLVEATPGSCDELAEGKSVKKRENSDGRQKCRDKL